MVPHRRTGHRGTIRSIRPLIYEKFLLKALAQGRYRAVLEPYVIGKGLAYVQAGLEQQRKGVLAQKVVISI
ncbi:hypothetical protein [Spirosoma lituiforme]